MASPITSASPSPIEDAITSTPPAAPSTAGTPTAASTTDCTWGGVGDYAGIESVEQLAWLSYQIVVGTVVEQLPPVWGEPITQGDPYHTDPRTIYTDTVIRVDHRVRGLPYATLRVRQPGGTIDGCSQNYSPTLSFSPGQQVLLFLGYPVPKAAVPTYFVTGGSQGYWPVDASGSVSTSLYAAVDGLPLP